jgi:hypothetical protein
MLLALPLVGKDILFRFIIECSSLGDRFYPQSHPLFHPLFPTACFRPLIPSFSVVSAK